MKAELLFRQRIEYDDGAIVEMVLWRVPSPVLPSAHSLKYSLFYGRPGVREVGYDNERVEKEAARRFVDAWHRAEQGEQFHEHHLVFESWDALARVLTGKRMELLRYVRRHKIASVRALAKALKRDYSNVYADVQALTAAGLLDTAEGTLRADYDAIETRIAI
jgi:predicted transcriptional regulator